MREKWCTKSRLRSWNIMFVVNCSVSNWFYCAYLWKGLCTKWLAAVSSSAFRRDAQMSSTSIWSELFVIQFTSSWFVACPTWCIAEYLNLYVFAWVRIVAKQENEQNKGLWSEIGCVCKTRSCQILPDLQCPGKAPPFFLHHLSGTLQLTQFTK